VTDVIHGVVVVDPYRWLEDRSLPETEEWIADQRRRCVEYFADCGDLDALESRVRQYLDVEVLDQPARVAGRYFYRRRNRGQEQASIFVRDIATERERLLVDPAVLGPFASVGIHRISENGSLLAYELKHGGEDRKAIHFVHVSSGLMLPDKIEVGYARGFVFTPDDRGFFYCLETPTTSEDHVIRLHLFDEPAMVRIVFRAARTRESRLILTADSTHMGAVWIHEHASELVADFWITLLDAPTSWKRVFANKRLPYGPVLKDGRIFVLQGEGAPNGALLELALDGAELRTIVPEQDGMIRQLVITGAGIFVNYLHNLMPSIHHWSLSGSDLGTVDIPMDGTIHLLPNQGEAERNLFYTYESFAEAPVIFEYFPDSAKSRPWNRRCSPDTGSSCSVRKVSFSSQDGTPIPMTLVSRHDVGPKLCPMIMTSYGGFGVPMTPQFSVLVSIMTELGAVFALPHIRGGGDFGKTWHDAGRGQKRQAAFDDFTAAAEWLCTEGLTSPGQLAIFGGSNSGLLVGAAMTQRPDLFCAVLCIAPLLDMVRYEQFDQAAKWRPEYGTVDEVEGFRALYAYSPYHHLESGIDYPAVLFVSGDKDDRCNPAHVRKMAARLQENKLQTRPVLVDYSPERGHSPVLPLSVRIQALARRIAFLCRELNMPITVGETK
jgi:prolyl oligopeptidase